MAKKNKTLFFTVVFSLFSLVSFTSIQATEPACTSAQQQADENAVAQYAAGGVANDIPYASNVVDFSNGITFEDMACNTLFSCYQNLVTQIQGNTSNNFKIMLDSTAAANVTRNIVQGSTTTAVSFVAPTAPIAATRAPHGGREYGRLLINAPGQTTSFKFSTVALGSQVKLFLRRAYVAYSIYNGAASDNRNSQITASYKITRGGVVQTGTIPSFCNGASIAPFTPASTPPANLATALSKNVLAVSTCPYEQLSINIPPGTEDIVIVEITLSSTANFKYAPTATESLINPQVTFAIDDITTEPKPALPEPSQKCRAPYQLDLGSKLKCDKDASAPHPFQYVIHYSSKNRVQGTTWEYQDTGVFWNSDYTHTPAKPGLYDVYSLCRASASTGSSPPSATIVCGKSTTKSDYLVRATAPKAPVAARVTKDAAIIFPQTDPCNLSTLAFTTAYDVYRKDGSNTNPFKANAQPIPIETMKANGFIDNHLNPSVLNYEYALQPLNSSGQEIGGKTAWQKTSWSDGFTIIIDHFPMPGDPTQILLKPQQSSLNGGARLVAMNDKNRLGFASLNPNGNFNPQAALYNYKQTMSLVNGTYAAYATLTDNIGNTSSNPTLESSDYGNIAGDIPPTTYGIWALSGDLAQQTIDDSILKQILTKALPQIILPRNLSDCSFEGNQFNCQPQEMSVQYIQFPTPHQTLGKTLINFYFNQEDESIGLLRSQAWRNRVDQMQHTTSSLYPSASSSFALNSLNSATPEMVAATAKGLATYDMLNLIQFNQQPGNNVFKTGCQFGLNWMEDLNTIFLKQYIPDPSTIATWGLQNEQIINATLMHLMADWMGSFRPYHGLPPPNELSAAYQTMIDMPDQLASTYGVMYSGISSWSQFWPQWPSTMENDCSLNDGMPTATTKLKYTGTTDRTGHRVKGYMNLLPLELEKYAQSVRDPRLASQRDFIIHYQNKYKAVNQTLNTLLSEGHLSFRLHIDDRVAGSGDHKIPTAEEFQNLINNNFSEQMLEALRLKYGKANLDICFCTRQSPDLAELNRHLPHNDDENEIVVTTSELPNVGLRILSHEGAHAAHLWTTRYTPRYLKAELKAQQAPTAIASRTGNARTTTDEMKKAEMELPRFNAKYSIWTEFRAYKTETCRPDLQGKPVLGAVCNNNEQFFKKTFFSPNNDLYRAMWSAMFICTKQHQGLVSVPCKKIEDLDWLPFSSDNGEEVCDPVTNVVEGHGVQYGDTVVIGHCSDMP